MTENNRFKHLTDKQAAESLLVTVTYLNELCASLAARNAVLEKNLREQTEFVHNTLANLVK